MMDDAALRVAFPLIDWDEPIRIEVTGHQPTFACRYCICQKGLKASELKKGESYGDILAHIEREHRE